MPVFLLKLRLKVTFLQNFSQKLTIDSKILFTLFYTNETIINTETSPKFLL